MTLVDAWLLVTVAVGAFALGSVGRLFLEAVREHKEPAPKSQDTEADLEARVKRAIEEIQDLIDDIHLERGDIVKRLEAIWDILDGVR